MSDELQPCALCGSKARSCGYAAGDPGATCRNRRCPFYLTRFTIAAWNALSTAAALARAVEQWQGAIGDLFVSYEHNNIVTIIDRVLTPEGRTDQWKASRAPIYYDPEDSTPLGEFDSLPAALIALAEQVTE